MKEVKKMKELTNASREVLVRKKELENAKRWLKDTPASNDELRRRRTLSLELANKKFEQAQSKYDRLI